MNFEFAFAVWKRNTWKAKMLIVISAEIGGKKHISQAAANNNNNKKTSKHENIVVVTTNPVLVDNDVSDECKMNRF